MTLKGVVADPMSGFGAKVSKRGQLVTSPLDFSTFNLAVVTTTGAFNLWTPKPHRDFIVTDIVITADRNVGVNDATVDIYEAVSPTEASVTASILEVEMIKQSSIALTGLNIIVEAGRWINTKSTDAIIYVNVAGYFAPAIRQDL